MHSTMPGAGPFGIEVNGGMGKRTLRKNRAECGTRGLGESQEPKTRKSRPPGTPLVNSPCLTFKGYNAAGIQLLALEGDRHFMKKPLGVSASAVFALVGSLFMLGFFVLLGLVLLFSPGRAPLAPEARLGLVVGLAMFGILGVWGTTTAIGLFRLRNWARVSILIFAGLLALTGVFSGPIFLLMPPPPTASPNYGTVRIVIAAIYGALGVLGLFWLYYFLRRATREAFGGTLAVESGGRPLSISIIGWWLLVTGVISVLASPLRLPVTMFIWVVTGWIAAAWNIAFGAMWTYVGYGLLRLNPIARKIAIAGLSFGAANIIVFFSFPGWEARLATILSRFHSGFFMDEPTHFPTVMIIPMVVGLGVPLWFLITTKKAFQARDLTREA